MAAEVLNLPTTPARGRLVIAALCVVAVAACGPTTAPQNTQSSANPGAAGIFNNRSANDLITAIAQGNLPVPNPRNVTAKDCPTLGCVEKVDTDTVSIIKFPNSGKAELYAGTTHHVFQIADIVIVFPPTMPPDQRRRYEQVVTREIQ
ncbi:MAG: hypothetical protein JWR32_2529 [Mycobacterium sp.]|jgi:hypothetical protein|nr:hypothetical protein [Mycobacterium sp.]